MAFVGREAELQYLNRYYEREGSQILVLYGQKGVGKTSLLGEFCADKAQIYYAARACSEREQRYQWAKELQAEGTEISEFPDYDELFCCIKNRVYGNKAVLVVDEFHHVIKGDGSFFAKLNRFVQDEENRIMVILASSAAGWVENHLVAKIGSEATAISGFLKIREFSLEHMLQLFPGYSEDDGVQLYAMLGGIPGLWSQLDDQLSIVENLVKYVLRPGCVLYSEMSTHLLEELREPAVYNTILGVIASGGTKLNDIYHHTGFSRAKISVYLKNLMEIDLVEKIGSGTYCINKPYMRFYYRFLFPNRSLSEKLTPELFYKEIVEDAFPGFVREAYRKNKGYE